MPPGDRAPLLGVMALQGGFQAHLEVLRRAGEPGREVRHPADLEGLSGLILPGGESTTHLKLMAERGLPGALRAFARREGALFGTCAGAILLAARVEEPRQESLGLLDVEIRRNAFGRQVDSFQTACVAEAFGPKPLDLVFIRAPRIVSTGPSVEVLVAMDGEPVLVRQGRVLAATFHPELSADARIHRYFAGMARKAAVSAS